MSLLRRSRSEVAGAWRSVRYDLGRRPFEPPAGGPDMTSTGMSTFGGFAVQPEPSPRGHARPRRRPARAAAITVFGLLTVLGAAGAYLGVVNGLGSLLNESPAAADTFPPATVTFTPKAGLGRGPVPRTTPPGPPVTPGAVATPPANATLPVTRTTGKASPVRTHSPASRECHCGLPPVPTPTAPPPAPAAPAPTSASAVPSGSDAGESPAPDATPDDSTEPSESPRGRHRRWRH